MDIRQLVVDLQRRGARLLLVDDALDAAGNVNEGDRVLIQRHAALIREHLLAGRRALLGGMDKIEPREPDPARIGFVTWLWEHGRLSEGEGCRVQGV
jgi:hypothetical protein